MTEMIVDVTTGRKEIVDGQVNRAPVTPAMVKAEARRRILAVAPEWRQLNAIREGETEIFAKIDAIRTASDAIEAMDPIPADYTAEEHWGLS